MYNIDINLIKSGRKIYFLFIIVGIIILFPLIGFIAVQFYFNNLVTQAKTMSTSVEVIKTDDDGTTMYTPVYHYEVADKSYTCTSTVSSTMKPSYENQYVYYDPFEPENCHPKSNNLFTMISLIMLILPLCFIIFPGLAVKKINKRIKNVKKLNESGKLVKNLPYRLEKSGIVVNGNEILRPVVDYRSSTGDILTLQGDPRHDRKTTSESGFIDLVIDEQNPELYFLDFDINRLSGNLSTDFYHDPTTTNESKPAQSNQSVPPNQVAIENPEQRIW